MINWIKLLLGITLIFTVLSCKEKEIPNGTQRSVFTEDIVSILNHEIPQLQLEYKVPAVGIGLIERGNVKLTKVYGEHQLGKEAPQHTIFNVASITKVITTMTVLKLVENGSWSIDEPLDKYWVDPDVVNDSLHKMITSKHALTHTIGFKNWRRMDTSGLLKFDFVPGEKYQYSGEGMEYLKNALENRFGRDLGVLTDSLLFTPLSMEDTTLKWISDKDTLRFAKWHNSNGEEHAIEDYSTPNADAADDLLITVNDLIKFGIAVMDSSIIESKLFKEMVKPQTVIHNNAKQGLGWTIVQDLPHQEYAINHDGGDIGVATTIILLPKSQSGIVVLTNGDNGRILCNALVKKAITFGDEIIKKLYWGGEIPEIINLEPEIIQNYSGNYITNQNTQVSFVIRDNALKIKGEGIPSVEIYPRSKTEFFPADFEVFFNFKTTDSVNEFELISQGKTILRGIKKN